MASFEEIVPMLHEQGLRMTRERSSLLDLFMHADKIMTPAQLHEEAQRQQVQVGLTTVYRLLEVLTKVGVASPFLVDGSIYYTFCNHQHHHHFICLFCHKIENIYECPAFDFAPSGCQVAYHKADLFGTCRSCSQAAAAKEVPLS